MSDYLDDLCAGLFEGLFDERFLGKGFLGAGFLADGLAGGLAAGRGGAMRPWARYVLSQTPERMNFTKSLVVSLALGETYRYNCSAIA